MGKKILSFDGGGIRGVISVTFLQKLEEDTGIRFSEKADIFAGTSTGSIIAGALTTGMKAEEILNFYLTEGKKIFKPDRPPLDELLHIETKYKSENLYDALTSAFASKGVDPKISLQNLPKKIVIPTVDLDDQVAHRWRMDILTNLDQKNSSISLIDAMMRSTAAPTFFPSYQDCVDGGMAANDPSLVAYAALQGASPAEPVQILSIGTGYVEHDIPAGESWGPLSWLVHLAPAGKATETPLYNMLFDVQEQLPTQLMKRILGKKFMRLNLKLQKAVALDAASEVSALIQETRNFIQSNAEAWEMSCKWVSEVFSEVS